MLNKIFGRVDADTFLAECITDGTATVSALELRELLQIKRKLERENNMLKDKYELLQLRNVSLKQELTEERCKKLEVYGINVKVQIC